MGKRETRVIRVPRWVTVMLLLLVSAAMIAGIFALSGHAYRKEQSLADIVSAAGGTVPILAAMAPAIADILFFLPWGFLAFLSLERPDRPRRTVYGATMIVGVAFALGIVAWQEALPTRVTGWFDAMWNTAGCAAGAVLGHARKRVRVRFE